MYLLLLGHIYQQINATPPPIKTTHPTTTPHNNTPNTTVNHIYVSLSPINFQIVACFPNGWFKDLSGDSTMRQLEPFCKYLLQAANKLGLQVMASKKEEETKKTK